MAFYQACATYALCLVAWLRVLAARLLGYPRREARKRPRRPTLDKDDLEANITTTSAIELGLNTLGKYEKTAKAPAADPEFEAFVGQIKPLVEDTRKRAVCEDHVLPLYHAQPPQPPPVPHSEPSLDPPPYDQVGLNNNPDAIASRIMEATTFKDYEEPSNGRMVFARGLQFTENTNFQFPASFFSALRERSPKSKRRFRIKPQLDQIPANAIPVYAVKRSPTNNTPRRRSNSNTGTLPATPTTPGSPNPPLSPFPASASSASSVSSSYASTRGLSHELDITSLPSWRRDPNRAKFIFGSLARGASTAGIVSSSSSSSSAQPSSPTRGGGRTGTKGIVIVESVVGERASQVIADSGFEVGFEDAIIGMGLTPPPTPITAAATAATPTTSTLTVANAATTTPPSFVKTLNPKVESIKKSGRNTPTSKRSRESIMSDVLSWVQTSSRAM